MEAALAGQGGAPILPLLKRAAQSLATSTNLWVRVCPALMPTEVGAIVHWACIDFAHAEAVVRDIEINRDVAMHRVGVPPDPDAPPGANLERHWERVMEFYSDQPPHWRAGAVLVRGGTGIGQAGWVLRADARGCAWAGMPWPDGGAASALNPLRFDAVLHPAL